MAIQPAIVVGVDGEKKRLAQVRDLEPRLGLGQLQQPAAVGVPFPSRILPSPSKSRYSNKVAAEARIAASFLSR